MIEALAMWLGRHFKFRGRGRLLQVLYPCRSESSRFIRGVRLRGDGLKFDADSRQWIDRCMLFNGEYEPHMRGLFQHLVTPGAVVVDVGANIGAHTLTLANLVGSTGRVLAFEPNPPIRGRLIRNLALNGFDHVDVYEYALGDAEGQLSLRVPSSSSAESANPGLASLVALDTPHELVPVRVRCFDELFQETKLRDLSMMKIDVQGFELHVLRGMRSVISQFSPPIVFEYEDWAWGKAGSSLSMVVEFFESLPYRLWAFEERGVLRLHLVDESCATRSHMDLIALHCDDRRLRQFMPTIVERVG